MKKNQFNITEQMDFYKSQLIDYTWDDIINLGILVARILELPKERKYKGLYWLSQKESNELITTCN